MDKNQPTASWDSLDLSTPPVIELPTLSSSSESQRGVHVSSSSPSPSSSSSSRRHHPTTATTYQPPLPRYPPSAFTTTASSTHSTSPPQPSFTQTQHHRGQIPRGAGHQSGTLGSPNWLEPEPTSPGASTLVDSPLTLQLDNSPFSCTQGTPSTGGDQHHSGRRQFSPSSTPMLSHHHHTVAMRQSATTTTTTSTKATSAFIASTSLSNLQNYNGRQSSDDDPSSFVPIQLEPLSAASKKTGHSEWDTNIAACTTTVTMHGDGRGDTTPTSRGSCEQLCYCAKHDRHDSCGTHGLRGGQSSRSGRYSPSITGSNTSARTLLAGAGAGTTGSRTSFLGGLLTPWSWRPSTASFTSASTSLTSSATTLIHVGSDVSNTNNSKHDVSPTGKVYMKRPKAKAMGVAKKTKDKGDGTRMAMFSNERTFLQWIRFGILLGSLSMTLLNFGRIGSLGYYVGTILVCIAMLALAYAAIIFHYRDRLLTHKLTARMLQLELKKQISSEPGALTAARISDIKGSNGAHMATDAGPATIVDVEPQQQNKGKSLAASAMQARIEKLKHRAKNGLYYDRVGPTLLGGALIVAYAFNFYLSVVSPPSDFLAHATGISFFGQA